MHDPITRTHPLTGLPLQPIFTNPRTGRQHWPILGGSEAATETGGQGAAESSGQGDADQQAAQGQNSQAADAQKATDDSEPRDGEDAAAFLKRVGAEGAAKLALRYRTEAGDRRAGQRAAEQAAADQKAATEAAAAQQKGIIAVLRQAFPDADWLPKDDTPADPQKIAEQLAADKAAEQQRETAQRTLTLENAVLRGAAAAGANADKLLDSRKFADTLAKLDPTDAALSDKVVSAMRDAVKADPSLRATLAATRSGVPLSGGSGEQHNRQPTTLEAAVGSHYGA